MKFTARLRQNVEPVWKKTHNHPFILEIGDATLPLAKYKFYMCQDYVYLIDYVKLFALGSIKAPDVETMAQFAWVLDETLHGEMEMHRKNADKIGIRINELERTEAAPITLAYVNYMLKIAHEGSLADLNAVLLPCMWSYWEIGQSLMKQKGAGLNHEIYGEWIKTYASDDFGELTKWLIQLMDRLADGKTGDELNKLEHKFIISSKFEYMFWNMAYNQEQWPL
jgi:thiaminase (transcriptional activator TenA)